MLFQPTNIIPSMFADAGNSTVSRTDPVYVSWQVNGNSPMVKAIVRVYTNDATHTQMGSDLVITPSAPFYPNDSRGNPQIFSYEHSSSWGTAFSLISGNDYLMTIEQFWSANDSVTQNAPVSFRVRSNPTLSITENTSAFNGFERFFSATYSQAENVPPEYIRWVLKDADDNVLDDTGNIYTSDMSYSYNCFEFGADKTYTLKATVINACGQISPTTYSISAVAAPPNFAFADTEVYCRPDDTIDIELPYIADSNKFFTIIRTEADGSNAVNLGNFPNTTIIVKDLGIQSKKQYIYTLYVTDSTIGLPSLTQYDPSQPIAKQFTAYTLVECAESSTGEYTYVNVYRFASNVSASEISNNNSPSFLVNFTKYPLRQATKTAPKSGTLQALICNPYMGEYRDSAERMEQLFAISESENVFFLKDPKGNLYKVHTSAPITQAVSNGISQHVTINIPWQEIGTSKNAVVVDAGTTANAIAALEAAAAAQAATATLIPLNAIARQDINAAKASIAELKSLTDTFSARLEALANGVFINVRVNESEAANE